MALPKLLFLSLVFNGYNVAQARLVPEGCKPFPVMIGFEPEKVSGEALEISFEKDGKHYELLSPIHILVSGKVVRVCSLLDKL